MIAVILLGAAAKRSQYSRVLGATSHLSKLVKMSESRIDFHGAEIGVLHRPATVLEFGVAFIPATPPRFFSQSVITPVALLSAPLRV